MPIHKKYYILVVLSALVGMVALAPDSYEAYRFHVPKGWPQTVYNFNKHKVTAEGFELGKKLFNDPILSRDNAISCAGCHLQFTAFTHADHNLSHGINGLKGTRNSIALFNLAWNTSFMWDGGVTDLVQQPINPITNPVEMGNTMDSVVAKLNSIPQYRKLFQIVYDDSVITPKLVLQSLAQFTVMITSFDSKYDSVMRQDAGVAFAENEQRGYELFKRNCASCHKEPLFTDQSFKNNGLAVDTFLNDYGRMKITHRQSDSLKFRVPSLRNVAASAPYMHDGRFARLRDVLEHYTSGVVHGPTLAHELKEKIDLTSNEKKDMIAFLNTLTDKHFLYDTRYGTQRPQNP